MNETTDEETAETWWELAWDHRRLFAGRSMGSQPWDNGGRRKKPHGTCEQQFHSKAPFFWREANRRRR